MTDVNLLGMFFDHENILLNLDKEDGHQKTEKQEDDHGEWFSEDTLNMLLKSTVYDYTPLFDQILDNENEIMDAVGNECSSDSGLSCAQSFSPARMDEADDIKLMDRLLPDNAENMAALLEHNIQDDTFTNGTIRSDDLQYRNLDVINLIEPFNVIEYVKEEVVECEEEVDLNSYSIAASNSDDANDEFIMDDSNDDLVGIDSDKSNDADDDSALSYGGSKIVKIANMKSRCSKRFRNFNTTHSERTRTKPKYVGEFVLKKNDNEDSDFVYPRLQLTPEEQKLANKEGIKLPTHYPLTKAEERDLKRIRRKIRNKISAQDSRRRKKEYVDRLEEKVKRTSEENSHLMKRIKTLESQKLTLVAQVRKLQASLARCSGQAAQPSTCLLVLIMSLALVLAPTLKNSTMLAENNDDEGISMPEDGHTSPTSMARSSRNLLFSHKGHEGQCNIEEEKKTITEQLEKLQLPDSKVLTDLLELLKLRIGNDDSLLKDHDYFKPRKRSASSSVGGESWPPPKMSAATIANHIHSLTNSLIVDKNNRSSSDASHVKEPVIIDLLSD